MFDPQLLSLETLLERVLQDAGTGREKGQYRSQLFPHSRAQASIIRELASASRVPVAEPGTAQSIFWSAEDYHQKYRLRRNSAVVHALAEELGPAWDQHVFATKLNSVGERGFDVKPWLEEMPGRIVRAFR